MRDEKLDAIPLDKRKRIIKEAKVQMSSDKGSIKPQAGGEPFVE
jgi:hypothetical protein